MPCWHSAIRFHAGAGDAGHLDRRPGRPTLTSLITQATPREEQGVVLGLTQSLNSVALIIAPPLGGYLIEQGWLTAWGLAASAVAFIGLVLASGTSDELRENLHTVIAAAP